MAAFLVVAKISNKETGSLPVTLRQVVANSEVKCPKKIGSALEEILDLENGLITSADLETYYHADLNFSGIKFKAFLRKILIN